MKLSKKIFNWKTWLFGILPIILFVCWLSLMIYIYVNRLYNATLIISVQVLFPLAFVLLEVDSIVLLIKEKHYVRGIVLLLILCVILALQIVQMTMVPKLIEASEEEQNAFQILEDTSYDDADYKKHWTAWKTADDKAYNISLTMRLLDMGSCVAIVFFPLNRSVKKDKADESGNDTSDTGKV